MSMGQPAAAAYGTSSMTVVMQRPDGQSRLGDLRPVVTAGSGPQLLNKIASASSVSVVNWYTNAVAAFWQGSGNSLWWSAACAGCAAHPPPIFTRPPSSDGATSAQADVRAARWAMIRGVTTLLELARAGDAIAATTSKLAKVRVLAEFLRATDGDEVALGARYFTGFVFPTGDERTLNVGGAAFSSVLREVSGADDAAIRQAWRRHADAGDVTRDLLERRAIAGDRARSRSRARIASCGDRRRAWSAKPRAAVLAHAAREGHPERGALRRQAHQRVTCASVCARGSWRRRSPSAFDAEPAAVSRAVMVTGDLGDAALLARAGRLGEAAPRWFVPLRPMLATPVAGRGRGGRTTRRGRLG